MPPAPAAVVLLVSADADSREMCKDFKDFLGYHGLVPIPVSRDVIATDILLPGDMDGIELIRRLKGYERTRAIPVIVLTACVWSTDRERPKQAGCDLFRIRRWTKKLHIPRWCRFTLRPHHLQDQCHAMPMETDLPCRIRPRD